MVLPVPPPNTSPIQNNPFYSPETTYFCGPYYPALVTPVSGICVSSTGVVFVTGGGGGGGVTALTAGTGIALSSNIGSIVVCTNLVAGTGVALTRTGNQIAISATGSGGGTVTSVTAGYGLTGGTITNSGTLALNAACVIPPNAFNTRGSILVGTGVGSYTALSPGTNGQVLMACSTSVPTGVRWATAGTITSVSGTAPISVANTTTTPLVSIAPASTTGAGAVQLYNNTNSSSTTLALTAAQGKNLQDQINAIVLNGNIELAGTIDASSGLVLSITSVGAADGYVVGFTLPAASIATKNTYVIVTTPGTLTPPGGSPTVATRGDWFLVSELSPGLYSWNFLDVGFNAPAATSTVPGIVELATNAETIAGTDATRATTPAGIASAYIPKAALTAKGDIISATAASTPYPVGVGTDGQVLVACSAAPAGLCWITSAVAPATPIALGTVLGCTLGTNAALGFQSQASGTGTDNVSAGYATLCSNATGFQNTAIGHIAMCKVTTGIQNVAVGSTALCNLVSGLSNDAVGALAMSTFTSGCYNVALGGYSLFNYGTGNFSTAVGHRALTSAIGSQNTALGGYAGCNITTGTNNVAIGFSVTVCDGTLSNQLAIGYAAGCNWLTGDGNKHIRPGAGVIDCNGNLGGNGQVLTSTGNAIQWATPSKQFISASIPNTTGIICCGNTVLGWSIDNALGISYFFGNFNLTPGKNYLVTTALSMAIPSQLFYCCYVFRWCNNAGSYTGPTILGRSSSDLDGYPPNTFSSSFVYSPVAGANAIQLVNSCFYPGCLLGGANSVTVIEV